MVGAVHSSWWPRNRLVRASSQLQDHYSSHCLSNKQTASCGQRGTPPQHSHYRAQCSVLYMQVSWDIRWSLLLWCDVHSVSWWLTGSVCTRSCAAWVKPHHAWDKASAAKRPQRDPASTITYSGKHFLCSSRAKPAFHTDNNTSHICITAGKVCVFNLSCDLRQPRLFGYTTPPRLSLLAVSVFHLFMFSSSWPTFTQASHLKYSSRSVCLLDC